jgi:hypothetical protein
LRDIVGPPKRVQGYSRAPNFQGERQLLRTTKETFVYEDTEASPYRSGIRIRHGTRRCVRAILEGLDDRLLVCIEARMPLADAACAGRQIAAWRAAYGDELEVLAFIRSGHADDGDCEGAHARRTVAHGWHRSGLPLAVGLAQAAPPAARTTGGIGACDTPRAIEQWSWPDNDVRLLLGARYPTADLLLARCGEQRKATHCNGDAPTLAHEAQRLAFGCGEPYDACMQAALVEQLAADCACGVAQACGIVIAWSADRRASAMVSRDHPLLSALAQGIRYRRLARVMRQHAPLRALAHCFD